MRFSKAAWGLIGTYWLIVFALLSPHHRDFESPTLPFSRCKILLQYVDTRVLVSCTSATIRFVCWLGLFFFIWSCLFLFSEYISDHGAFVSSWLPSGYRFPGATRTRPIVEPSIFINLLQICTELCAGYAFIGLHTGYKVRRERDHRERGGASWSAEMHIHANWVAPILRLSRRETKLSRHVKHL